MSQKRFLSSRLLLLALASVLMPLLLSACGSLNNEVTPTLTPTASNSAGSWTTFTNANNVTGLAIRGNEVWWATSGGVVKLDQSDSSYIKYTTDDGLGSNNVLAVAVDPKGNLWFGTSTGVSWYDGKTWHSFNTSYGSNSISNIVVDLNGNVLAGNINGIMLYDGTNWSQFKIDHISASGVYFMEVDRKGNLWFSTEGRVYRYDMKSQKILYTSDSTPVIGEMAVDSENNLWMVTDHGLKHYDGHNCKDVTVPCDNTEIPITALFIDKDDVKWLAISGQGVCRYDGKTCQTFTTRDGLANNSVTAIAQDEEGNIWFGTDSGISRYSP